MIQRYEGDWGSHHLISSHLGAPDGPNELIQAWCYWGRLANCIWIRAAGVRWDNGDSSGALTWQPAATIDCRSPWNINFLYVTFRLRHMFNSRLTDWREKLKRIAAARHLICFSSRPKSGVCVNVLGKQRVCWRMWSEKAQKSREQNE